MSTPATTPTAEQLVAAATPTSTPTELEFKFPDGSVVKGKTQEELLQKTAERYTNSRAEADKIKAEAAQLREQVAQTPTPVPTGFDSAKFWEMANVDPRKAILYALADEFEAGTEDNFKKTLIGTVNAAQTFTELSKASSFMTQASDFPAENPQAATILTDVMEKAGVKDDYSVDQMLQAHAFCIKNKLYEPASTQAPSAPSQALNAPPMLNQGAASITGAGPNLEEMANTMSQKDLKAAIEKLAAAQ